MAERLRDSMCPVTLAIALVGDRSTLMILSELSLGTQRFDDLQAQTGMSPNLLTARLRRLEADGIVERRPYEQRPLRYSYHSTAKGQELDPLLMMLRVWGERHKAAAVGAPLVRYRDKATGEFVSEGEMAVAGLNAFRFSLHEIEFADDFQAERSARAATFKKARQRKLRRPAGRRAGGKAATPEQSSISLTEPETGG